MPQLRLAALLLILLLPLAPLPAPAAEAFTIHAILPITGSNAFSGKAEAEALGIIESRVNGSGGIDGRPIHFAIQDNQSNPVVSVQLANQAMASGAQVILGPSLTANCGAVAPLLGDHTVMWCFSPGFHPAKDSFGFSSNSSTTDLLKVNVRYFRLRGWKKIAIISSTDASGQDGERGILAAVAAPENTGMTVVDTEHFNTADLNVDAQMAKIKASGAQALFAWATGTPLATLLHGAADVGLDIPIAASNANAFTAQMESYAAFMPKMLLFAGQVHQARDQAPRGPIKNAVDAYYAAFRAATGADPEADDSLAWDSTLIVVDALRKYGPDATAAQIHGYIESLHDWYGANGGYDFRNGSQRGIGAEYAVMVRWDPQRKRFVAVSKLGGAPL